jgi:hypothetical protein
LKNGSSCYPLMACIVAGRALRMEQGTSQLWELLLLARSTTGPNRFTCAECFAVLEHDADARGVNRNLTSGLEGLRTGKILNPDSDWV